MASAQEYSPEELNYFRVCSITTRIITGGLRKVFKRLWDARYKATHGQWQDTAKNGNDLYSMESPKSRKRHSRELAILRNGNSNEWDCTYLFFAILYSDSIGKCLTPADKKDVDDLRQIHNNVFAHVSDGKLTELDFQASIQTVISAFSALKLDTADIEEIKNQKTFPTEGLRITQQQLQKEKMRNEEPRPFCVLPPKPSHEVVDRSGEVTKILKELKRLRSTKTNEVTMVYLSGNPGCGKSEVARQIGGKLFDDVPGNATDEVKFVFTLNASSTDTLLESYIEFAISLNCDENSTTTIGTSKDLSQEDKLIRLKSLVNPKLRKYSSWILIVDNVTDIKSVFRYLPQQGEKTEGSGQILVTTQDSRYIGENDSYNYHLSLKDGMKPDEAVKTLVEISGVLSDNEWTLRVAKTLDFQPIALACAATYMKSVSKINTSISWKNYFEKLQEGKREATEAEFERISKTYSRPMTAAVKLALKKEMAESMVMMHVFQFLSVLAPERIQLEYVVQYVTLCLPDQDEDLVATIVRSSSLILCSEDKSKEIGLHQVVHSCLEYIVLHKSKEEELKFLAKVIHAFSALLNAFDKNNVEHIITTKGVAVHIMHISNKLFVFTTNPLSSITLKKHFQNESINFLITMGNICQTHGHYEAVHTLNTLALMIAETIHHDNHPNVAMAVSNLGNSLSNLGQHKEAQKCYERALSIREMAYSENHPTIADTLNNLGNSLRHLGQHKEAQKCYERALSIAEMAYSENHPTIADTLGNLGISLNDLGQHKEAQKCYERALSIAEMAYRENHPTIADTLDNLGTSLNDLGQHKEAQKCHERALSIKEMAYSENHPTIAGTLNNLGISLRHLGQHKEAQKCYERALSIKEMAYSENHPTIAGTLDNLGTSLNDLGQHKEAQKCHERALSIKEMAYSENHPTIAGTLNNLGISLRHLGQLKEAQKCYERALSIYEMAYSENHPTIADTLDNLGTSLNDLGQHKEAQKCHERALSIKEMAYSENHPTIAGTLNNLGISLRHLGQHKEAQKCYERALSIKEMAYSENHSTIAGTLNNLGISLRHLGQHKEAQKCYERALSIKEMAYSENHPTIADTLNNLGNR